MIIRYLDPWVNPEAGKYANMGGGAEGQCGEAGRRLV